MVNLARTSFLEVKGGEVVGINNPYLKLIRERLNDINPEATFFVADVAGFLSKFVTKYWPDAMKNIRFYYQCNGLKKDQDIVFYYIIWTTVVEEDHFAESARLPEEWKSIGKFSAGKLYVYTGTDAGRKIIEMEDKDV